MSNMQFPSLSNFDAATLKQALIHLADKSACSPIHFPEQIAKRIRDCVRFGSRALSITPSLGLNKTSSKSLMSSLHSARPSDRIAGRIQQDAFTSFTRFITGGLLAGQRR